MIGQSDNYGKELFVYDPSEITSGGITTSRLAFTTGLDTEETQSSSSSSSTGDYTSSTDTTNTNTNTDTTATNTNISTGADTATTGDDESSAFSLLPCILLLLLFIL